MDTNRMRLGLVYIFDENKNIPSKAKLHLINFIENANKYQLKVLAMDGELIPKESIDENTKSIIEDRFETRNDINEVLNKASLKGIKESIFKKSNRTSARLEKSLNYYKHKLAQCQKKYVGKPDKIKLCQIKMKEAVKEFQAALQHVKQNIAAQKNNKTK